MIFRNFRCSRAAVGALSGMVVALAGPAVRGGESLPPRAASQADPQTLEELWRGYDPRAQPLNEEVIRQWQEGGIDYREVWFDGDRRGAEPIRIYGIFAAPREAEALPGLLHVHGGGQTVNPAWLRYWAGRGYAIFSFNWGGEWPNRPMFTRYPADLPQGNQRQSSHFKGAPGMAENSWMVWTRVCRRALTYLESRPQVDSGRLGTFGISMGGTLMWNLAFDDRIKAACAIYGAGWNSYRHEAPKFVPSPAEPPVSGETLIWRRLGAPEAYAPFVRFPMLFLNASNDQHGDFDRVLDTLDAMPAGVPRRQAITPRFRHHISRDFMGNLPAWMDHYLKGGPELPQTPRLSVTLDHRGVPVLAVEADESQPVERVEIYYGLEHPHAVGRHWRLAASGRAVRKATAPVMRTDRHLMAFANVHYADHVAVTSNLVGVLPSSLGVAQATLQPSPLLFGPGEPDGGWTCKGYPTDPIPGELRTREYYPKQVVFAGEPAVQPDPRVGMLTYKLGDPQFRASPGADRLQFAVAHASGTHSEILLHKGFFRPGAKTYRAVVTMEADGEAWREVALGLEDFQEVSVRATSGPGEPLASFEGIEVIEVKPLNEKPWSTEPPLFGRFRWGFASPRPVRRADPAGPASQPGTDGLTLEADSFALRFDRDGRPVSWIRKSGGADLPSIVRGGEGFYLKGPEAEPVRLSRLSLELGGRLVVRSVNGAKVVVFRVTRGRRHLAFRIERVEGITPEGLEGLHFQMDAGRSLRVLDLDYMTRVDNGDQAVRVEWTELWRRLPNDPLGGFALYETTGDDDEDATLVELWVGEGLPHPKIDGEWTIERARQWIGDWQSRFAERDQLILAGRSLAELRDGVRFARRAGMKQIYLFTDTWRTDPFWPSTDLNWAVNRAVFPRGEADLREFSEFVRTNGMYLALHYVSGGVGLRDPVYVGQAPDRRFASWGRGRLAHDVAADDLTLVFAPAAGVVRPEARRPSYPRFFDAGLVRVNDELVRFSTVEERGDGTWMLKDCRRGQGSTLAVPQRHGAEMEGLLLAYGQNLVPDNDSTLLGEIAENYASLLNRCLVEHVEFDGAEIHAHDGRWGYRKFATRIYASLTHPTTAHDSAGRSPPAWFEYRLNSSRRLMRGSCSYSHGNYSVPVTLDTPSRPATTLLDAHFILSQGNGGGALGICKPEPMFGVTMQMLEGHGLTGRFIEAMETWREVNQRLTDEQRERLNAHFSRPRGTEAIFNRHLRSPVVPVARRADAHYEIVPTRVLTRESGDILWQHGQEHGAISPRQFVKLGEPLLLQNPDSAQPAQFIIRVLPAFDPGREPKQARAGGEAVEPTLTEFFVEGNDVARPVARNAGVENVLLQPPDVQAIRSDGFTTISMQDHALVLSVSNPDAMVRRETENLPSWNLAVDMTWRRGVGMWVTGDGSGAVLLVKLGRRDYVVPIDFHGRRYVEIPNGEVSWASGRWGWRMKTKSTDYSRVRSVQIGFGELPGRAKATVRVEQLTALGEIPAALENPVIWAGTGSLRVHGTVPSGRFLQYTGGDTATVHDENWHRCAELPVVKDRYVVMPTGEVGVTVTGGGVGPRPWLEVQFITTGTPMIIAKHTN